MALLSILGLFNYDSSVMEGFNVPENVDRDTAVNSILLECAELELIYSNIEIMKLAIATWSDKELPIWTRLQKTNELVYNPIYNVDGVERETQTRDLTATGDNVGSVHGFNSSDWAEANKSEGTSRDTGTVTTEKRRSGNIGVTTTQKMIQEERDISTFDIIEYIVKSFKRRFCLGVY